MKIQPLLLAMCVGLCANAKVAQADNAARPPSVVPPMSFAAASSDDSLDFSELVNFMFFVKFLDRYYGVPTDAQDPIEVNPLSIVYATDDDPDAFDVSFFLD
jgi:hypothetical protein